MWSMQSKYYALSKEIEPLLYSQSCKWNGPGKEKWKLIGTYTNI